MSYQKIVLTGQIVGIDTSDEEEARMFVENRRVVLAKDGVKEYNTIFLCHLYNNLAKAAARLSQDNLVSVAGQLIPDEKGNPPWVGSDVNYEIDVRSVTLLSAEADSAREDIQDLTFVGFTGRDPEMRYTPDGTAFANGSVATEYIHADEDGKWLKDTLWLRFTLWGARAESFTEHVTKGTPVIIELGGLTIDAETGGPRTWERKDGSLAASFEGSAYAWRFSPTRKSDGGGRPAGDQPADDSDDIPF